MLNFAYSALAFISAWLWSVFPSFFLFDLFAFLCSLAGYAYLGLGLFNLGIYAFVLAAMPVGSRTVNGTARRRDPIAGLVEYHPEK